MGQQDWVLEVNPRDYLGARGSGEGPLVREVEVLLLWQQIVQVARDMDSYEPVIRHGDVG